jgi:orotate phosphoribosyltransferase
VSDAVREQLLELIRDLAVFRGPVVLASGQEANVYVDLQAVSMQRAGFALVGKLMDQLVADWRFDAVGGMTMGADPVAFALAAQDPVDVFSVRKHPKRHGDGHLVEGPVLTGRKVLVVEDVMTTGASTMRAVETVIALGAEVVGVATVVARPAAPELFASQGLSLRMLFTFADVTEEPS